MAAKLLKNYLGSLAAQKRPRWLVGWILIVKTFNLQIKEDIPLSTQLQLHLLCVIWHQYSPFCCLLLVFWGYIEFYYRLYINVCFTQEHKTQNNKMIYLSAHCALSAHCITCLMLWSVCCCSPTDSNQRFKHKVC